ncbi:chemokine-like receptor 1 [Oncorhynchus tshawytscha]|uniref:G-protein coupled receptors family 1 profile domain-containing protein n=1 Tax=Oncorhynchus tshawytscha TaxID=74940 RepID=A0AAZ3QGS6_ONCTS|nr:chemokine-like receptor 1 [Oncorhynchus tshawytscha]
MEDFDYTEYGEDYTAYNETYENTSVSGSVTFNHPRSFSVETVINILISLLGLSGNAIVIWISGFKMRTSVNTTWYLSLAISDFLFCVCLPFNIVYMVTSHWPFGLVMCKLTSSAMFLNMFSSVFLLVLISVDRCVSITFPVWAQNNRTIPRASGVVVLVWALSAALTVPSLVYRQTKTHGADTLCYTDYQSGHKAVALSRFVCGFVIPLLIIVFCYSVIFVQLRSRPMKSTKPVKVMTVLIVSFFVCWVPYHTFVLLELNLGNHSLEMLYTWLKVGSTMAAANSFLNPILYVLMGHDFRQTLKRSVLWKIENAMAEDGRTGGRNLSKSGSFESKAFTHV